MVVYQINMDDKGKLLENILTDKMCTKILIFCIFYLLSICNYSLITMLDKASEYTFLQSFKCYILN